MNKPPRELIEAFFDWYRASQHSQKEDFYSSRINAETLGAMSRPEFIEFFFQFAHEGGNVQSGGYRKAPMLRETMKSNFDDFRAFAMEPFEDGFDAEQWIGRIELFKGFGQGIASIYLNRVDKQRFAIINNKACKAVALFGVKVPIPVSKRYAAVRNAWNQLMEWYPQFENFYQADALSQFLVGEDAGSEWKLRLTGKRGTQLLGSPFDKLFDSMDEANALLDLIAQGLGYLNQDVENDNLTACTFQKQGNRVFISVNFSIWAVLALIRERDGNLVLQYNCRIDLIPNQFKTQNPGLFKKVIHGQKFTLISVPLNFTETEEFRSSFEQSLRNIQAGFSSHKASPYRRHHRPELYRAIFDTEARWDLLTKGMREPDSNNFWIFQANPKFYDIVGALRDEKLRTWTVKSHKTEIAKGDRVIIWVTGSESGCYALCEITSDVLESGSSDATDDAEYYHIQPSSGPHSFIELRVLHNLWDRPIDKTTVASTPALTELKVGRQGTVFSATAEQYDVLVGLMPVKSPLDLPSKNIILYGPPGTGKTYALRTKFMDYFTDRQSPKSREQFTQELVSDLSWWEVTTMVMLDLENTKVADILAHPLMKARIARSDNRNPRAAIWAHLQMHTKRECETVAYTRRYEPLLFEKSSESMWSIDREVALTEVPELAEKLATFKNYSPSTATAIRRFAFTTFHQSFSYEDFIEGIKPVMGDEAAGELSYEIRSGIFRQIVTQAKNDPDHDYALFIDEINRGNVASIFGELITLLEDDKRLGAKRELTAVLPYSRDDFGVPANLYVIGTMNTADRSVEALDTALRRRFTFVECAPQPELLRNEQPAGFEVDLEKLLTTINARIERLLDADHCIGHSYFMGLKDAVDPLDALRHAFANKVLPLLKEYFYGDPGRVGMVLGNFFVKRRDQAATLASGDWEPDGADEREIFQFADPMTLPIEAFTSIYA